MPAAAFQRIERNRPLAGLLMVKQTLATGSVIDDLILIWRTTEFEEWKDQVVFLPIH